MCLKNYIAYLEDTLIYIVYIQVYIHLTIRQYSMVIVFFYIIVDSSLCSTESVHNAQ